MPDREPVLSQVDDCQIEPNSPVKRNARFILDPEASPEAVRRRYLARAGQYFFRDRNNVLAFEDKGVKIATRAEDPVVAESMVELAIAKGWKELKVTGSESFRRTVWLESARRGMTVRGYEPKPQDELQLKETLSRSAPVSSTPAIGLARARAFSEQPQEEALKVYPELQKAYAGRAGIYQWIATNIPDPERQIKLRSSIDRGMAERLAKGEIPSVVVLPDSRTIPPEQAKAIHRQAVVMGAVARVKGHSPEAVSIVIAAAERLGRHLSAKGVWIPEPMVYDRNAPPRTNPSLTRDETGKPEIQRKPKLQVRR